jgi:RimJ/RimL family protein N-acetyltransferase
LFSQAIADFWRKPFVGTPTANADHSFAIFVNPQLSADRRVTLLRTVDGTARAAVTPAVADAIGLDSVPDASESTFRQLLNTAGIRLHEADCLFYFAESAIGALIREPSDRRVRQLTDEDTALFAEFTEAASEQDLDDAYVELDHWAVFGSFERGRLVSAASAYPWGGSAIADIGVLTLPDFRGRGHARGVVRAISRHAYAQAHQPQYRCQLDNGASQAVAAAAAFTPFGTWEVVAPEADEASES